MEGHAGAGQVTPVTADADASPEATAEDSSESEAGADQTSPEATAEDSSESEAGAEQPLDAPTEDPVSMLAERRPSRLGRRWVIGICAVLTLLAGGPAAGGYLALRAHRESQATARDDAAAIAAARDCLAATQAPDSAALPDAQRKIFECSTGDFGAQAVLYAGMLVQTYQAADVHVQVSEMRTAVERNYGDGSVGLLAAVRVKVDTNQAQGQEFGYRLRVKMAREDGQYKIANLDQVAK